MKTERMSSAEWGRENCGRFNKSGFGYSHSEEKGIRKKQIRNEHLLFTLSLSSAGKHCWFFFFFVSFVLILCPLPHYGLIWFRPCTSFLGYFNNLSKECLFALTQSTDRFVVQSLSHVQLFKTPWIATCHISLSFTVRVCSNSCSLSQWCHPTISSSVAPFPSFPQSSPASGYFPMSELFASGDQSIEASASVLPINIQGWFPLGLTDLISLLSKGLSRVFSSTLVWKH